ncbi:MAG: TRIC cation channel family protein [Trueperaceae bacterium]|nr:TRIC cation channel family protein [Trueperaceae bacterium]
MFEFFAWLGTITFAATGALVAVQKRFDLVGALVLASVTAVGGGAIRDVTVGILPPSSFTNEPLLWVVALTALLTFYLHRFVPFEGRLLYALDTLGLAIFAALGAERGLSFGLGMWGTIFAGAVSGVGGGVLRDVLSGQVPGILYRSGDFYASAAAAGALAVFLLYPLSPTLATLAGVALTITVRVGSRVFRLELPVPRDLTREKQS